ncbi:MAG: hypothetical protein PWP71_2377 [Clostridia bacterium]|nr:hypothetical protein [Clostridia bacterium]
MRRLMYFLLMFVLIFNIYGCSDKKEPVQLEKQKEITNPDQELTKSNSQSELNSENKIREPLVKPEKDLSGAFIVSIDNHRNAYPQSGLEKADRVYEILAEGGITRYLAIFHSKSADKIGPVRSARYYFAYIVKGHDFPFAHAGGNTDALNLIPELKIKDLDEIYNAGAYFWRDKSRKMPHNLYTSTKMLLKGARKKNFQLVPLKPLEQGTVVGGEPADLIDITYSSDPKYLYTVTYEWDGARYKRYINGTPHKTLAGDQIYTENIIVMEAKTREVVKDELESEIDLIGKGKALYFTNGKVLAGTWEKEKAGSEFRFFYNELPMKFTGEHSWINIVPSLEIVNKTKIVN